MKERKIRKIMAAHVGNLLEKKNVVAVGIGYKKIEGKPTSQLSIVCSVKEKIEAEYLSAQDYIPETLDLAPTDVQQTGEIYAQQDPTLRHRPVPGGVSIGHIHITAGTNGCAVVKKGELYFLSNNHVLANSNNAKKGDAILQPGPHDGGTSIGNKVAELSEFVPIIFEGSEPNGGCFFGRVLRKMKKAKEAPAVNYVDCAIAKPLAPDYVRADIFHVGLVSGMKNAALGMTVCKSGRTTKYTKGVIEQVSATVRVNFCGGRTALFYDQIITSSISQGGDSGSLVLNLDNKAVGLLFAGSDSVTICNRIQHVFSLLSIDGFAK